MKKRIVAGLLTVAMAMGLMACGGSTSGTSSTSSTSKPSGTSGGTESSGDVVESTSDEKDYSEHLVFSYGEVSINEATDYNGDDLTKWWEEKFNFEWDVVSIPQDSWQEKVRIWINSGDLPDVTIAMYNHAEMLNYIDQGLVYQFPEGWQERWPNVAKTQVDSEIGAKVAESVGGTYFLARPVFSTNKPTEKIISHVSVYLRADWAKAVGFELKDAYTVSEIMEYCRLVKEKDPGKVGDKLVPLTNTTSMSEMFFVKSNSTYGYSSDQMFYRDEDGVIKWGPGNEDTLTGLKLWRQAYEEGLISPEFYTINANEDAEAFYVGGTTAATFFAANGRYIDLFKTYVGDNLGLDSDAVWTAAVVDEEGYYHESPSSNYYCVVIFRPDLEQEKFERYMDILDYSATQEGQYMIRMGFQGTDWDYDENGDLVSLLEPGTEARSKYPSIYPVYHRMLICSDDFVFVNPAISKESRDRSTTLFKEKESRDSGTSIGVIDYDIYFYSSDAKNALSIDLATEYASLVTSEKDIETAWKEWVESYAYLVDPVLEELNANVQ